MHMYTHVQFCFVFKISQVLWLNSSNLHQPGTLLALTKACDNSVCSKTLTQTLIWL